MKAITKEWCEQGIFLDPHEELMYGSDQANICCPVVFPTVEFELPLSDGLIELADEVRFCEGYSPRDDGWYNFYVGINGYTETHMDNCIKFVVNAEGAEDDYMEYAIELDRAAQEAVYERLDTLCKGLYGKGCNELLVEAEKEMGEEE